MTWNNMDFSSWIHCRMSLDVWRYTDRMIYIIMGVSGCGKYVCCIAYCLMYTIINRLVHWVSWGKRKCKCSVENTFSLFKDEPISFLDKSLNHYSCPYNNVNSNCFVLSEQTKPKLTSVLHRKKTLEEKIITREGGTVTARLCLESIEVSD